ncbi:MAG: Carbamoyl-phosphate synthase large chain, partial [Thermodesulfobacteriota bacterium]|nr:Carbamoyl-phosphate synthase large chain [Thermodesulfobacteriota bacterium]
EAFQKSIRSVENGRYGLGFAKDFHQRPLSDLLAMLSEPSSERQFIMYEALRKGASIHDLYRITHIKPWFIDQMKQLVDLEERLLQSEGRVLPDALLEEAKKDGFSDRYLAGLLCTNESTIRNQRLELGLAQAWEPVPVSGVENAAYYYSTYNARDKSESSVTRKVMVLGGGPNRIGQGIEFDYCCVHAAFALRDEGFQSIMVNCNPETVSTDYDTSDKLYFEPLTVEDVLSIYEKEKPEGVIVQFGGQTPLNIANELAAAGVRILGTSPDTIDLAEDRDRFRKMMRRLGIPQPDSGMAANLEEAIKVADLIGYPLMVRPSYVLGGRAMEVIREEDMLRHYVAAAVEVSPERPILIDKFLENAIEVEADAVSDGRDAFVPAVMEHIELAGVHSGDSACVIPPISIPPKHVDTICEYTRKIAVELKVVGLMNIQYAIANDTVYILEANPRASRTVPIVSKVCNIPMARIATQLILGRTLDELDLKKKTIPHYGVKEAVFPFNMFPEVDPILGPEMRSTGEVLGLADSFGLAFFKAQEAAQQRLPATGSVMITVSETERPAVLEVARQFRELGFNLVSTGPTYEYLQGNGIQCDLVSQIGEARPNIIDAIMNRSIQLVINTPTGRDGSSENALIRRAAIKHRIPYVTTLAAAIAAAKGIRAFHGGHGTVRSLQSYHADIR